MICSAVALFALVCGIANAIPIDNQVLDNSPEVECLSDRVRMVFSVKNPFQGRVYAKNFYQNGDCNRAGENGLNSEWFFDSCGVVRTRSLEPKGVFVTGVIVIQFHPYVLTKIDRAIRFQCFYMEADKTVDQDLEVSMITTEFQTFNVPMPVCRYDILDNANNPAKFVKIGDKLNHVWTCDTDTEDIFCMEVYGCYVNNVPISSADDDENAIRLMDFDGCAMDGNLLNTPDYDDTENFRGLRGSTESHAFKFADRSELYFNCQIRIGVRDPGTACQDYREFTGGVCPAAPLLRRRRAIAKRQAPHEDRILDVTPNHALYVADLDLIDEDVPSQLLNRRSPLPNTPREHVRRAQPGPKPSEGSFCVSLAFFSVLVGFLALSIIASATMGVILCTRRSAKSNSDF